MAGRCPAPTKNYLERKFPDFKERSNNIDQSLRFCFARATLLSMDSPRCGSVTIRHRRVIHFPLRCFVYKTQW